MSETSSEKTEQPTPKKLRDAREKGQVVNSKEVVSVFMVLTVFLYFMGFGDWYIAHFKLMISLPYQYIDKDFSTVLPTVVEGIFHEFILLTLPLVFLVFIAAIVANVGQFGFIFSAEQLKPDIKKINPVEGAKKLFSIKSVLEFIKSLIKVSILMVIIYYIIKDNISEMVKLPDCTLHCVLPLLSNFLKKLFFFSILIFILIAVVDYLFERYQHIKELKMTHDEVKREHKETEGGPEIKGKRKQFHQELLSSISPDTVKRSNVIVTNPTHLAIGIHYERGTTPLPIVTCKGKNYSAQYIVELAKKFDVPILQKVSLARSLMLSADVNQYIPRELLQPVAEVIRWLETVKPSFETDSPQS